MPYATLIVVVGAVSAGLFMANWIRIRRQRKLATWVRASEFALSNFEKLVHPRKQVITKETLLSALRAAGAEDSEDARTLRILLSDMQRFGHVIGKSVYHVPGRGRMLPMTLSENVYGISRMDLWTLLAQLGHAQEGR